LLIGSLVTNDEPTSNLHRAIYSLGYYDIDC
jgi:hypothetical protein